MPGVINEFEIVVEAPTSGGPPPAAAPEAGLTVRPEEIVRVANRQRERLERVRAD